MIHYFFQAIEQKQIQDPEHPLQYRIYAIIDELYYWKAEWLWNETLQEAKLQAFHAGFLSEEVILDYKKLPAVNFATLRDEFGSFAYFIERAVNGFKSYIIWISPDPQMSEMPWQISPN